MFHETAIRVAAGNKNGRVKLDRPSLRSVEQLADPKSKLKDLLLTASELTGRRRTKFNENGAVRLVAEFIEDFSPLRELPAFRALEADIKDFCVRLVAQVDYRAAPTS